MVEITIEQWNNLPHDYKSKWTNEKKPEYVGRRFTFASCLYSNKMSGSALAFEGIDFIIIE